MSLFVLKYTATAKSLQSCPTLCDPIDGSPPGSPVPGILQARTLEWVAISFSSAWQWKVKVKSLSRVRLFVIPRTTAHQAPPSMGFPRQEYWSGMPLPSPWSITDLQHCASSWCPTWWFCGSVHFIMLSACKGITWSLAVFPTLTFHPHDLFCSWKFVPLGLPCPLLPWLQF